MNRALLIDLSGVTVARAFLYRTIKSAVTAKKKRRLQNWQILVWDREKCWFREVTEKEDKELHKLGAYGRDSDDE